ncbi:uncharacterized protein [Triticum aestivum]|uniref:uncharacterized protein isoform X1 n=1 Tax=Triticum aestivum TaxID=4565 RepID=UPI001D013907|nr:uncharacterized protein LOC123061075 isoform X1 [Triticum aestivum]
MEREPTSSTEAVARGSGSSMEGVRLTGKVQMFLMQFQYVYAVSVFSNLSRPNLGEVPGKWLGKCIYHTGLRKKKVFVDSESEDNDGVSEDGEDAPSMHDQQEAQMQVEKETQIQVEKDTPPTDGNLETRRSVRLVKKKTKGVNSLYPLLRNLLASIFFLVFYDS